MLAIILVLGSKAFGSASYTRCARTQQRKDFDFNQQVKRAGEVFPISSRDLSMKQINGYRDLGVGRVTPSIAQKFSKR
jgi:hypothetical protein